MLEIADRLLTALDAGRTLAVGTVVRVDGSAPRTVGTSMAYDGTTVIGTVAGGCVEAAVVEVCERVLGDGRARTATYGVSDETAFSVGLTCGGRLRVHVQRVAPGDPLVERLRAAVRGEAVALASVLPADDDAPGELGSSVRGVDPGRDGDPPAGAAQLPSWLARRLDVEVAARLASGRTGTATLACDGAAGAPVDAVEVFVEVAVAPPRLVVVGAMDFSVALAAAGRLLGYRVTVCDPRPLFATAERFPGVEVVRAWPTAYLRGTALDGRTAVCVLSHDARFDTEAVALALASPAGYVGAMGSRRTHERRVAELRARGVGEDAIARLRSPIGLDVGASTPQETAVAILAEVLAVRSGASGEPLRATSGPIHRTTAEALAHA
ncbi:XdhC family protein [Cellulomonas cellasea]|uniref:Xanthine dehydrogenase accessory factor n=1 Tax=Cellulomonas cellasea TaxID=43670 RepID=A0A7W4UEP8_9CELL|nr:XdhC/CoxI family protein [Cellulomonas cellasea]MBB2922776.1 xanthine dehydrogenase accessory factor [Cellulomonas cellasea]